MRPKTCSQNAGWFRWHYNWGVIVDVKCFMRLNFRTSPGGVSAPFSKVADRYQIDHMLIGGA